MSLLVKPLRELELAQRRYADGAISLSELVAIEREHLDETQPISPRTFTPRGTTVVDACGDAWRFGARRWTRLTPVDGSRITSVARLPQRTLVTKHGPVRVIGSGPRWTYETIRGRA